MSNMQKKNHATHRKNTLDERPAELNSKASWQRFQNLYQPQNSDGISLYEWSDEEKVTVKRKPHQYGWLRGLVATAACIVLLFAVVPELQVTAIKVWNTVITWNDSKLQFGQGADKNLNLSELEGEFPEDLPVEYLPKWVPEGYEYVETTSRESLSFKIFTVSFYNETKNDELFCDVRIWKRTPQGNYEKDEREVEIYTVNGVEHMIFYNLEELVAVWVIDNYEMSIDGRISKEDMRQMIDSIYEKGR
ncbi:MAG: DUF4367 domain-containing protein [Firmicutes bacterium]|nr:DUF4367 domain-containing protein [Bacillota bacterium]